ncbi:MAG: N-acetyl-gamma-glutamyl-phosphate reductase, partial [Chloroflexota bacterium]
MVRVGIINVSGYAGSELARLLWQHPGVKLVAATGRAAAGQKLGDVFPHLADFDLDVTAELGDVDLVFSAMPHKASCEAIVPLHRRGIKVIDISADFRLKQAAQYQEWYQFVHPYPELLGEAVYGLSEIYRSEVSRAKLIANPGCYPASALLALAPALKAGVVRPEVIVDSKSGISGAGRALSLATHFCEASDSVSAYSLEGHRHLPEIVQEMTALAGTAVSVTFVPHLVPMTRGILSTCYAPIKQGALPLNDRGQKKLRELYHSFYRGEPFVRVMDDPPQT